MLLLAFDTSSPAVSVAVAAGQPFTLPEHPSPGQDFAGVMAGPKILAERTEVATNRHGELLAPLIQQALADAGATPADLTAIGVGVGPGPFTGLRVGIVTAKAMADALGITVYGECSLDLIGAHHTTGEDDIAVVTDARRKQVYWAVYSETGARMAAPELAPAADVASALRGRVRHVVGAGAVLYRDAFDGFAIVDRDPYPLARELLRTVYGRVLGNHPREDLTPMYLRRPDAQPPGPPKQVTPT